MEGKRHTLSVWFVPALRLMIGLAFFRVGLDRVLSGEVGAPGYPGNAPAANGSPAAGLFAAIGENALFVDFASVAVPWGEVLIGLGAIAGLLTRLVAFWGAFMVLLFYLGDGDVSHGYINGGFAYVLVFPSVAAFGAGRILGLGSDVEAYEVGGQPLVERYPRTRYRLG
ncbi:MAG: DoxX family protein [Halorubrum sp.]